MLATVHIGRWRVATSSHQKIWDSTRRPPGRRLADEGVKYDRGACDEKRSLGERDVRRRGQFGHGPAATYRYDAAVNTASPARAAPAPEPIRRARDAVATEETKEAVKARAGARKAAETRCPPVPGERGGGDTPAYGRLIAIPRTRGVLGRPSGSSSRHRRRRLGSSSTSYQGGRSSTARPRSPGACAIVCTRTRSVLHAMPANRYGWRAVMREIVAAVVGRSEHDPLALERQQSNRLRKRGGRHRWAVGIDQTHGRVVPGEQVGPGIERALSLSIAALRQQAEMRRQELPNGGRGPLRRVNGDTHTVTRVAERRDALRSVLEKADLQLGAPSSVSGGTRRVLTWPALGAVIMMVNAHMPGAGRVT